jgi:CDP-glucose 4,6-dehydratase
VAVALMKKGLNAEDLRRAYEGKKVLLTGHTGFKGAWMALWLEHLGAEVTGYALAPETTPSLFDRVEVAKSCRHIVADIRDGARFRSVLAEAKPDIVLHLAAQALVRRSYSEPIATLDTNVMGTAHVLEAVRLEKRPCAVVVVTSDKCYENREWVHAYRENDPMGGHDVYSMSKGAAELVVESYRSSFFPPAKYAEHGIAIASGRAGNCIGGGDWSLDRIVPDAINALTSGRPIPVRNQWAVRPWQHVLEPLGGYLLVGAKLLELGDHHGGPSTYCSPWNFGPAAEDAVPVKELVEALIAEWGSGSWDDKSNPDTPHEAGLLRLSTDKAHALLGWTPRWRGRETFRRTVDWYRAHAHGASNAEMRALTLRQIDDYMGRA